jgi:hypothetical protein
MTRKKGFVARQNLSPRGRCPRTRAWTFKSARPVQEPVRAQIEFANAHIRRLQALDRAPEVIEE